MPFTFWGLYLQDCQYHVLQRRYSAAPLQVHSEINLPNNLLAFLLSRFIIRNAHQNSNSMGPVYQHRTPSQPDVTCGAWGGPAQVEHRKTARKSEFAKNALHGCLKVGGIQFKDIHETKQAGKILFQLAVPATPWCFWLFEFSELYKNSMGEVWQHLARAESSHPVFTLLIEGLNKTWNVKHLSWEWLKHCSLQNLA